MFFTFSFLRGVLKWHQETDYPYRKRWKEDGVKKVEAVQKSLEGPSYPDNPPASIIEMALAS